jgi:polyhydroxyalkanoate synthesis regulator phasin
MGERASERGTLESVGLAGVGALALAIERADELAEELAHRLGVERTEVRGAIADVLESWRREAHRFGESTGDAASKLAAEVGVASRERVQELELRVAQLEHRLKLLERAPEGGPSPPR